VRLLAALVAALALVAPVAAAPNPADLESELVCPTCKTTLDQSDAPVAQRMKQLIRQRIAEGKSADEIKAELVDSFGRGVLAEPPKSGFDLLAWLLPLAGAAVAAAVVGVLAWRWSRSRSDAGGDGDGDGPGDEPLDPELERRLDAELARFDP
jgi:cytochrome c-type biogenesis protein CcmH